MPLATLGAWIAAAGAGLAQDRVWERSAAALAQAEATPGEATPALRESLRDLEQRDAGRQREFSEAAARPLPAKAAERLERARAAYQAGQGRLLELLRQAVDGVPAPGTVPGRLREAKRILARLEESSRGRPISADDLPVGAPALRPPTLGVASGTATTVPIGPVPQTLKDAADALPGVVEVYEWVRNAVAPEFYHGVMKGGVQAYLEQAGNDADTAAVLVSMLRAKGVPARYVRGIVALRGETLARAAGTANVEQAIRVLERAGIPHEIVLGGGGVASVKLERVWTEAYLPYANYRGAILDGEGKVWVPLDAAFKRLADPSGQDAAALGFDPQAAWDEYLAAPQTATPIEFVRARLEQILETQPETSYDSLLNRRVFGAEVHGLLPNSLPYKVVSVTEVSYDLPDALAHTLRLTASRDGAPILDTTVQVRDVLGRRLTVSYEPASDEDAQVVTSYGSLATTPPYLIEVKPVVRSGGIAIATGTPIGMSVPFSLQMEFMTPGGTRVVTNRAFAGNTTAIGLGGRAVTAGEEGAGTAAEILSGIAHGYWRSWNDADDELADLMKVVPVRPMVSACLVSSAVEVEYAGGDPLYPVRSDWKGLLIDADLRSSAPVGVESRESETPFLLLSGLQGSILEDRVFETRHDIPAVSTAKALALAASEGILVHDVTAANVEVVLPGLPFDADVKAEVRDAVARGFRVRIPAQPVSHLAWTGVGYVILDPTTGAAAYQLQGGHSGGVTAPSVIDFPANLRDALEFRQGEPKQDENRGVARLQKLQSTDFQIGIVNKGLARPLRVLVTDGAGYPMANTPVTFTVIGGGGVLVSPQGGAHPEVDIRSNQDGIAQVVLLLGKRTDAIPRFLLPEPGQEHATQVGLNLVTARAELARLDEPFLALGLPDDQRDAQGLSRAALTLRGGTDAGWSANLRVATRLSVGAEDPYGNPISNFPIRVAYRPLPVPTSVPGYTSLRDATTSPGGVLRPPDFERCAAATPIVAKGTCAGEATEVVVRSSALGAFSYPVLGGSPLSLYYFDIGTPLEPNAMWIAYPTTGPACYASTRAACGEAGKRPDGWTSAGSRAVLVNTLGNLVEAYPPGDAATAGFWTDVVYEKERIVNRRDEENNEDHFFAEGTNEWVREHLDNSQFKLTASTGGTSVGAAGSVGNGQYEAAMTLAPIPLLNTIAWEATLRPKLIPYLSDAGGQALPGEVDPRYVDNSNPAAPRLRERVIDPNRAWSSRGTFSVWGVRAHVSAVDPAPIFLRENLTTAHDSLVRFAIEPAAFGQELLPIQVVFELSRDAVSVLSANGSGREPDGSFRIPAEMPLAEGQYTATLSILGVSGRTGQEIVSQAVPVEAGVVSLTVDTNNDTVVDDADDEAFRKDPSRAFAFWEADPDPPQPMDALQDYATVRIRVPVALRPGETLALSMPSSRWVLRKKVGTGKDYLKDAATADAQLASIADAVGQPTGPIQGRWEIPHFLLQSGVNEFLMRCDAQPDGKPGCSDPMVRLERVLGHVRPVLNERRVAIEPLRKTMGVYTARSASDPFAPSSRLFPIAGWKVLPLQARRITVFLHGFNVNEADAIDRWFTPVFKRLYWVGQPVLWQQDRSQMIGVSWPGDQEGDVIPTPVAFYPENEFNALRTGVAFAQFLYEHRTNVPGRALNILAHSLGNMVVNSGINQLDTAPLDSPVTYVMNEAAIAAEAFDSSYQRTAIDDASSLQEHARSYGEANDARWEEEWRAMFVERDQCPPEPAPCGVSDYYLWQRDMPAVGPELSPAVDYRYRWRLRRPSGRGQWTGYFATNFDHPGISVFNSYNRQDYVLRVDQGRGNVRTPHAWFTSQRYQKPNVGLGIALQDYTIGIAAGAKDGRSRRFWGIFGGLSSKSELASQEYLWGNRGNHSNTVRQWLELAHWFPATSGPAGTQPLQRLGASNIDFSEIGGEHPESSHSYIRDMPLWQVWEAFARFRSVFAE